MPCAPQALDSQCGRLFRLLVSVLRLRLGCIIEIARFHHWMGYASFINPFFWSIYGLRRSSDSGCTWTRWTQRRNPIFRLHIHTNISFASARCSVKGNSNPLRVETGCNKPFPSYAFHICVWNEFFFSLFCFEQYESEKKSCSCFWK